MFTAIVWRGPGAYRRHAVRQPGVRRAVSGRRGVLPVHGLARFERARGMTRAKEWAADPTFFVAEMKKNSSDDTFFSFLHPKNRKKEQFFRFDPRKTVFSGIFFVAKQNSLLRLESDSSL